MNIYLAGPDVFRPDALAHAEAARRLVASHGHRALLPLDNEASTAADIYRANLAQIAAADLLIANLNPFRGFEPDSGTVFEVGYAVAAGKPVLAYVDDDRPLADRLAGHFGCDLLHLGEQLVDGDGMSVENHGLPLNLMLGIPLRIVRGGLEQALQALAADAA